MQRFVEIHLPFVIMIAVSLLEWLCSSEVVRARQLVRGTYSCGENHESHCQSVHNLMMHSSAIVNT